MAATWLAVFKRGGGSQRPAGADLLLQDMGGGHVQVRWVPSHLDVRRHEEADALALLGRQRHPNKLLPLSNRGQSGMRRRWSRWMNPRRRSPQKMTQRFQGRPRLRQTRSPGKVIVWQQSDDDRQPPESPVHSHEYGAARRRHRLSTNTAPEVPAQIVYCIVHCRGLAID